MAWLATIWLIFTAMFLALGCFQWRMVGKSISHFQVTERPMSRMQGVQVVAQIAGADVDQPLKDFVDDFNSYIDYYNRTSSKQHKAQAIGYLMASATAIFSFVLTITG